MDTPDVTIRPARAGDLPRVRDCVRRAYTGYIDRIGREPAPMNADFAAEIEDGSVIVALLDTSLVGCATFLADNGTMHLRNVAVCPEYAGRGIGRCLIRHVEQAALRHGHETVGLYTNQAMTENLAMYPRLGYVEVDRREEDGFQRVYFRKTL